MRATTLSYFIDSARLGSFSLAAKQHFVSQQGLSKSIKALENELGVELFIRDGNRIYLTKAGSALLPLATHYVETAIQIKHAMLEYAHPAPIKRTDFVLYAMPFVSNALFTLLEQDKHAQELSNVVVEEKSLYKIIEEFNNNSLHGIAAIGVPCNEVSLVVGKNDLEFIPLFKADLLICWNKNNRDMKEGSYTVAEISKMPIAYYSEPVLNRMVKSLFAQNPLEQLIMHSSNLSKLIKLVEDGHAITFTDSFSVYADPNDSLACASIKENTDFIVGLLFPRKPKLNPKDANYVYAFEKYFKSVHSTYSIKHPL